MIDSPQLIHDLWLALTVIAILETFGVGLYLWKMSDGSRARKFLRALAVVLFSVSLEQVAAEIKNLIQQAPPDTELGLLWLSARTQQVIATGLVLRYLIFGTDEETKKVKEQADDTQ